MMKYLLKLVFCCLPMLVNAQVFRFSNAAISLDSLEAANINAISDDQNCAFPSRTDEVTARWNALLQSVSDNIEQVTDSKEFRLFLRFYFRADGSISCVGYNDHDALTPAENKRLVKALEQVIEKEGFDLAADRPYAQCGQVRIHI